MQVRLRTPPSYGLGVKPLSNSFPNIALDNGRMQSLVDLSLVAKLPDVDRVRKDPIEMPPRERTPARCPSALANAGRRNRRLGVQRGLEPDHAAEFEIPPKQTPDEFSLLFDVMESPVLDAVSKGNRASHPYALAPGGGDLVADALAGDLPLKLREGQQHV